MLHSLTDEANRLFVDPILRPLFTKTQEFIPLLMDHLVCKSLLMAMEDDWVREQLTEEKKTLSDKQLMSITPLGCETLIDKGVQDLLDKEEFRGYIPVVCTLGLVEPAIALRSESFRRLLIGGFISFDETLDITSWGRECLTEPNIVAYIIEQNLSVYLVAVIGQLGHYAMQYIDMEEYEDLDAVQRYEGISNGGDKVFREQVQFMAEKEHRSFIPLVAQFSDDAAAMICNPWVMERIIDKTITFGDVTLAKASGACVLYNKDVQRLMMRDENKSSIPFVMQYENPYASAALNMEWFRERIRVKRFTFVHIATIPSDVFCDFDNKKTQGFFTDGHLDRLTPCVKEWLKKCNLI